MRIKNWEFPKRERMVSQKLIDELFSGTGSRSLTAFPVRVVYRQRERQEGQPPVQVLISVPKKRLHHAVDRNRVKRQLREAYRLNKVTLITAQPADRQLLLAFIWLSDRLQPSERLCPRVQDILRRVAESL